MKLTAAATCICFLAQAFAAVTPPAGPSAGPTGPESGWPREFSDESGSEQVTVYEPQVESWKGNHLEERAAVAVQTKASPEPTYGVIWITARTETDKANHVVTLEDIQITHGNFPARPDLAPTYLGLIRLNIPNLVKQIALDRLQANLAVTKAEEKTPAPKFKNSPPQIIYSKTPAVLVLIDGQPVLREAGAANIMRVINTRALIVLDQSSGKYYFYLGDRWMESRSVNGPWAQAASPPASLEQVKKTAVEQKEADLLNDPDSSLMKALSKGSIPQIFVATHPAELIQTAGAPQLQPVSGTQLLYVNNTANNIFVNTADQNYYVLISGRWYRSPSLNGPWSFVSAKKLPRDFAQIPEAHPKGTVLASVSGTPQAQEAGIANDIPQTATVDRAQAQPTIRYDGTPVFKPIEGTPLQYALNSQTPVIQVDPSSYFAVQNGIWFAATSPQGPWVVAARVPAVIYTIPPSSPIYYVTYVRIYGSTPDVVYVGYTPGYLGSYTDADGVVVYGTGYYYPGWVGTAWYGPPCTYGFGWYWGPGFGWGFAAGVGFGVFAGVAFFPWWGPWGAWGWGWGPGSHVTNVTINNFNVNHSNVYRNWHGNVVRNTWSQGQGAYHGSYQHGQNNVYAGRNGQIYRYGQNGWQAHSNQGWQSAHRGSPGPEIEQSRQARNMGEQRYNAFRSGGPQAPQISRRSFPEPSSGGHAMAGVGGGFSHSGGGGGGHR